MLTVGFNGGPKGHIHISILRHVNKILLDIKYIQGFEMTSLSRITWVVLNPMTCVRIRDTRGDTHTYTYMEEAT